MILAWEYTPSTDMEEEEEEEAEKVVCVNDVLEVLRVLLNNCREGTYLDNQSGTSTLLHTIVQVIAVEAVRRNTRRQRDTTTREQNQNISDSNDDIYSAFFPTLKFLPSL